MSSAEGAASRAAGGGPGAAGGGEAPPFIVFAALGDRTRLALLERLADGRPRSIATLSQALAEGLSGDGGLTRQAVTKHLDVLEKAGLVARARVGRESRYAARPEPLLAARAYLETVSAQWDAALSRLEKLVEE